MVDNGINKILEANPLVPVVTFQETDDPSAFMDYLLAMKVSCIEVTLRTKAGLKAIELLKNTYGDSVSVGAGTVSTSEQIEQLKEIRADFMVSPGLTNQLFKDMLASNIPFLPGVATPSEIMKAKELGLTTLKFFPAHLYGGLDALKMFGGLFPDLNFCPTGGISESTSKDFLELNNVIAVGGSWFQKEYNKELKK